MIVNIIEFILLKFDDINLVPKKLIEQLFTLQKLILALITANKRQFYRYRTNFMKTISIVERCFRKNKSICD